jgi:dUTP pyrophosphatase
MSEKKPVPPEVVEQWENHWKALVCDEAGNIVPEKVMCELFDYGFVMDQVSKVYCEITGGLLSKPNYYASVVIGEANDYQNKVWDEVLADEKKSWEEEQMSNVTVKIKKLFDDAIIPRQQTEGAAGVDLHARVSAPQRIYPGQRKVIGAGIAIELPPGYEAQVRPRSGLAIKKGISIVNSPGTVDADYRGEVGAIIINHGSEAFDINNGDRIAQLVIQKVPEVEFVETDELSDTARGAGGMGSTGV